MLVRQEYRGDWTDIYLGGVRAGDRDRCCIACPDLKLCVHYRWADRQLIRAARRPAEIPARTWKYLTRKQVR
ncbi:hypothetical protein [Synechococcus sp. PCC 7336]|uniref:hypothetical protein n=1 Tax=Synechococcus sp. PCC 7336 TaxID=195250 RepID=UPI00034D17A3|nr:hypothetical protein [Synechococcus sp. PCC 7336]